MDDINQIPFNFDPRIGIIVGVMVGFLVFAVSLDLTWEKLLRVVKRPKAPIIGLLAQFGILPVLFTFVIAVGLGWVLGLLGGLVAADRRAVAIEVAFQNVALAIGLGITFFPSLGGIAAVAILWGIVHLTLGLGLAIIWNRLPL
ncbi:hypothetical protein U3A58_19900 [Algoriphagus sp. C2-6-M1]|uniref:hypothetical protein n=1 Tax=Algoriphagus persicinus TaxID=3108754 RepID=UPI002B3F702A|nr:hypothetical protein [Algoriphagus sp. C2-6-M1]MEB2782662.1 hypothetical protein [Algoriphagus sp. C2-6-M1]